MTTTRFDYWQTEREAATVTEPFGVKVWKGEHPHARVGTSYSLKIWMPKATKPFVNVYFKNAAQREQYATEVVDRVNVNLEARAASRQARKHPANAQAVEVGTLFVHSWGYDQTNVDYYEVVKKSGSYVEVKAVASREVPGSSYPHGMACEVQPVPGAYLTDSYRMRDAHGNLKQTLRKKVQYTERGDAYLSFEFGWCGVTTPGEKRYCSWYA